MAFSPMNVGGSSEIELIDTPAQVMTSTTTFNLSANMSDYKYLLFYLQAAGNEFVDHVPITGLRAVIGFMTSDYFANTGSFEGYAYYGTFPSSLQGVTCTVTYVNDTQITAKATATSTNRLLYVYGIK